MKRPGVSKRKLRGGNVGGPRSFSRLLEDVSLKNLVARVVIRTFMRCFFIDAGMQETF